LSRFEERFVSDFSDFYMIVADTDKGAGVDADLLKYNPDQPRDKQGRFASSNVGFRVGKGDITVSEQNFIDLQNGSAGKYMTGRTPEGQPIFTTERQALHDQIVADAVDGVPSTLNPTYYMLGGGPAAGKTRILETGQADVPDKTNAVHINADDIKEKLPEYAPMVAAKNEQAAGYVHEESSYLAKRIQAASVETSRNIVLDGTGDSGVDNLAKKVGSAKKQGYKTVAVYASVDTDVAVERMVRRYVRTGRLVPEPVVRETHANVSRIFPAAVNMFDSIKLFDTSDGPKLIATGQNGKLSILDQTKYSAFLAKGEGK
jgi:predicted ABC-type ATPase